MSRASAWAGAIANDSRLLWRSAAARITLGVWTLALLYALFSGAAFRTERAALARAHDQSGAEQLAEQQAQRLKHERGEAGADPYAGFPSVPRGAAVLTPAALSFLAVGQQDLQPFTASVSLLARPDALLKSRHELASPMALAVGRFDAVFAVVFLMPLALIALSHGQFAEERERGRLSLLAVQHGALPSLLALRLGVRFAAVALPLVLLTGAATLLLAGPAHSGAWLAWLLPALAWLLFWTALSAALVGAKRSAGTAALALAAAWLLLVLVLPMALNAALQWIAPAPSQVALAGDVRAAERDAAVRAKELLGAFLHDHPELDKNAPGGPTAWTRSFYAQQQTVSRLVAEASVTRQAQWVVQHEQSQRLRYLAPAAALQQALIEAAGSGEARHRAFAEQLGAFKQRWDATLRPQLFQGQTLSSNELGALPRFAFVEPAAPSVATPTLVLLAMAAVALLIRWPALRRLNPAQA